MPGVSPMGGLDMQNKHDRVGAWLLVAAVVFGSWGVGSVSAQDDAQAERAKKRAEARAKAQASQNKRAPKPAVSPEVMKLYVPGEFKGVVYRLMSPIDFDDSAKTGGKKYPLILLLHGGGGRGTKNIKSLRNWHGWLAEEALRRKHPCFVLAPQTNVGWRVADQKVELTDEMIARFPEIWKKRIAERGVTGVVRPGGNLDKVFELVDKLSKELPIDVDRVYVLGHSMGGAGTWTALGEAPKRFAAAIPTAGGLSPWYDVNTFKHVPIWSFHGDADTVVPTDLTRRAFEQLKAVGGNMKYTEVAGMGHGVNGVAFNHFTGDTSENKAVTRSASDQTDKTADVWDWLFAQKRQK
jgi:predicted peptidase